MTVNEDEELEDGAPDTEVSATPAPLTPEEQAGKELANEIDSSLEPAPRVLQIPFDFVTRHDKKTVQLLANSGSKGSVAGKRIWFDYDFSEICFLEQIIVNEKQYSVYSDFEIAFETFDGERTRIKASPKGGAVQVAINKFVKGISFRPPRHWGAGARIESVTLYGFPQSRTDKFGHYADSLDERRDEVLAKLEKKESEVLKQLTELKALEDERQSVEAAIKASNDQLDKSSKEISTLRSKREELVARVEALKQSTRENEQTISNQKNKIGEVSDVRSKLARSIIAKEQKLKHLTDNINLFPSELSDFVSQGARDVRLYALLSAVPILVIAIMFAILVEGGVDLTTKITGEEDVNIAAIFISRMPFVIVAATVITACYYLARMFILEMVRVNRQKLSLSKIGIIAKDISYSIENELDYTEEEKYSRRLRLKMDMLRDHLKEYLSKDFEPSLPKRSPFEQISLFGRGKRSSEPNDGNESEEFVDHDDASQEDTYEEEAAHTDEDDER